MRIAMAFIVAAVLSVSLWLSATSSQLYIVKTGSMAPTVEAGDAIVARAQRAYRPGDVVTFRLDSGSVITHRLVGTDPYRTKGDANEDADVWQLRADQVLGALAHRVPFGGYVLVFLRQPAGIGFLVTHALSWLLAWRLFFPPAAAQPTVGPSRRRPHVSPHTLGAGACLILALSVVTLVSRGPATGAYFSSSAPGEIAMSFVWDGPDGEHGNPGNGNPGNDKPVGNPGPVNPGNGTGDGTGNGPASKAGKDSSGQSPSAATAAAEVAPAADATTATETEDVASIPALPAGAETDDSTEQP